MYLQTKTVDVSIYDNNVSKYKLNITKLDSFDLKFFVRFKIIKFVWRHY